MAEKGPVFSAELLARQQQIEALIHEDDTDEAIALLSEYCQQLQSEMASSTAFSEEAQFDALTAQQQWLEQMSCQIERVKQKTAESLLLLQKSRKASDGYIEHNT